MNEISLEQIPYDPSFPPFESLPNSPLERNDENNLTDKSLNGNVLQNFNINSLLWKRAVFFRSRFKIKLILHKNENLFKFGYNIQSLLQPRGFSIKYKIVLNKTEEGYSVYCPGLPGCWSQGDTELEAIENIKDAIQEYLTAVYESTKGDRALSPWSQYDSPHRVPAIGRRASSRANIGMRPHLPFPRFPLKLTS